MRLQLERTMTENTPFSEQSLGIVETQYFTFGDQNMPFNFECGKSLHPITLAYETYGTLNSSKDNAILICHALSGTAHAAGFHNTLNHQPGWWNDYIGPGKAFDTDHYFVICSNIVGGCNGSTGPSTINHETGTPYGLTFPMVTIKDMVQAQKVLIDYLGIPKLVTVAGGSMGGMQALEWGHLFPDHVQSIVALATSASLSAQGIALNEVGRQAIIKDPLWKNGNYYQSGSPINGLSLARMIGHITYMSEQNMHERFGRKFQDSDFATYHLQKEFMVESYLHHQGVKFVDRFDANTYLYITKAIDYFNLADEYSSLAQSFEHVKSNYLLVSFSTDWLYTTSMVKEIVTALRANSKNVIFTEIETDRGHDAFLLPNETLDKMIRNFIKTQQVQIKGNNE